MSINLDAERGREPPKNLPQPSEPPKQQIPRIILQMLGVSVGQPSR